MGNTNISYGSKYTLMQLVKNYHMVKYLFLEWKFIQYLYP